MTKDIFIHYIWLVDTIRQQKRISLSELRRLWSNRDDSYGQILPERTFHRYRKDIEALFDINIKCDKSTNEYYIENVDDVEMRGLRNWLLDTFSVGNLLHESRKLRERILLEEVPSGRQHLTTILRAMRDGKLLNITYKPFGKVEMTYDVAPYCVKLFKQRWYLIAKNERDLIRNYALDRVRNISVTNNAFTWPKNFDPQRHFLYSFGIVVREDTQPCKVKLKAYGRKRDYIRTLPLHKTQEEIKADEDCSVFSYFISPTSDFVQEILSHGSGVEVISPDSLRSAIIKELKQMQSIYHVN
jgi:hypothetical protein